MFLITKSHTLLQESFLFQRTQRKKIVSAYNRILRQEYDVIEARILTGRYSGRIIRGVCDYLNIPFRDEWQLAVNRRSKEIMENYPKGKPDCKNKEIVDDKQTETVQAHLSIPQRLERIQNEICLNYCRFPLLVSEFNIMQEQYCSSCPLMDLL